MSVLRRLDALAHVLYTPTALGRRGVRARWHHRIHLIPGWLLANICDRFERGLAVCAFYEEDEPVNEITAAFDRGPHGVTGDPQIRTRTYTCPHLTVSGPLAGPPQSSLCRCQPRLVGAP